MDPATRLADGGGEHVHERGEVVLGHELALVNRFDGEARLADRSQLLRAGALVAEQAGELLAGGDLDLAPRVHARFVAP